MADVDEELRLLGTAMLADGEAMAKRIYNDGRIQALPGFQAIDPAALVAEGRPFVRAAISLTLFEPQPHEPILEAIRPLWISRRQVGIPLDAMLVGLQIVGDELWRASAEGAVELGLSVASLRLAGTRVFDLVHEAMAFVTDIYHQQDLLEASSLTAFLQDLFAGRLHGAELDNRAKEHRLDPTRDYRPFLVHTNTGEPTVQPVWATICGVVEGDIAGLVVDLPHPALVEHDTVGFGPGAPLADMAIAFDVAQEVARVASMFTMTGVVERDDLGMLTAVAMDPELGDRLVARYLTPLDALGDFGERLLVTVEAYFDHDRRIENTAHFLAVHHNTLRNRLARFAELTGADLQRSETAFEVWWALQRRRLLGGSAQLDN